LVFTILLTYIGHCLTLHLTSWEKRIILTGSVVFMIWTFFSPWLFVEVLEPAFKKPVHEVTVPRPKDNVADSFVSMR